MVIRMYSYEIAKEQFLIALKKREKKGSLESLELENLNPLSVVVFWPLQLIQSMSHMKMRHDLVLCEEHPVKQSIGFVLKKPTV